MDFCHRNYLLRATFKSICNACPLKTNLVTFICYVVNLSRLNLVTLVENAGSERNSNLFAMRSEDKYSDFSSAKLESGKKLG